MEYDSLTPVVTVDDIMKKFHCQRQKAKAFFCNETLMPKLHSYRAGSEWVCERRYYDVVLEEAIRNGFINFFNNMTSFSSNSYSCELNTENYFVKSLLKIGFTKKEIIDILISENR